MYQMNTGRVFMGYPSLGSWVTYGLGSESENLPAYVVMTQPEGTPEGGAPCWGAGLPAGPLPGDALPQRARRRSSTSSRPAEFSTRRAARDARPAPRDERAGPRPGRHRALGADRDATSWPSGCRVPRPRPSTSRRESDATKSMYGLDDPRTVEFGTRCLLARRLVERGVRFVQLYSGGGPGRHAVGRPRRHRRQPREDVRADRQAGRRPARPT